MSVITIFGGIFCNADALVEDMAKETGYQVISDEMIIIKASELSGISRNKIKRAFSSRTSVFNQFTHEKECALAYLKLALAKMLGNDTIITGFCGLLIPHTISHALRICLVAKPTFRLKLAGQEGVSPEEAADFIRSDSLNRAAWTGALFSQQDPWAPGLYDMVLPMDKKGHGKTITLIKENLKKTVLRQTEASKAAAEDFLLAATAEVELVKAGHNVGVHARQGAIVLTINRQVLMLDRLKDELKTIALKIKGVLSVKTRIGEPPPTCPIYWKHNIDAPSKVLLVDDEREFVQTLSERLQIREIGAVVAYDGESALALVEHDEPEVMIIDLKMPGIDGMQVLKEVKQTRPKIEVIVLTGHGSEQDREECMALGAFAYMQKPVDINLLSQALNDAHKKNKTAE